MERTDELIGKTVVTADGKEIGTIKELLGLAFKVDAPRHADYWLPCDAITGTTGEGVELRISSDDLGDYKLAPPEEGGPVYGQQTIVVGSVSEAKDEMAQAAGAGQRMDARTAARSGTEELNSDTVGTTRVWSDVSPQFRQQWQNRHDAVGTWEEFEPGFHFGYEMASDPRFMGRPWEDVEPELRAEYTTWSGLSGAVADEGAWDRVRNSARTAWGERPAA